MAEAGERRCRATNRDGSACRVRALPGRDRCYQHADDLAERRAARNRTGGKNKSNANRARAAMPEDVKGVGALLLRSMQEVKSGDMAPAVAHALAGLARSYVAIYEAGQVEVALEEIEAALKERAG